jgi:hypothetical protein
MYDGSARRPERTIVSTQVATALARRHWSERRLERKLRWSACGRKNTLARAFPCEQALLSTFFSGLLEANPQLLRGTAVACTRDA